MKNYYDGETPCHGCGRPGTEKTRSRKDGLCYDCQDLLKLGRQVKAENGRETKYTKVSLHIFACRNTNGNVAFDKFLSAINNDDAADTNGYTDILPTFGSNRKYYNIPEYIAEAVNELLQALNAEFEEAMYQRERIPKQVEEQMNKERNKIYNEGVAYGRNLLTQLNRGEIGLSDFEAVVEKY